MNKDEIIPGIVSVCLLLLVLTLLGLCIKWLISAWSFLW